MQKRKKRERARARTHRHSSAVIAGLGQRVGGGGGGYGEINEGGKDGWGVSCVYHTQVFFWNFYTIDLENTFPNTLSSFTFLN